MQFFFSHTQNGPEIEGVWVFAVHNHVLSVRAQECPIPLTIKEQCAWFRLYVRLQWDRSRVVLAQV